MTAMRIRLLSLLIMMVLVGCVESVAADQPSNVQRLLGAADSCMAVGDYFHAMRWYERALGDEASDEDAAGWRLSASMRLAECRFRRADYGGCIALLESLPKDSLTHDALRELFYGCKLTERRGEQLRWGERLLQRFPMDSEVVADLALAYNLTDDPERALTVTGRYEAVDSLNILVKRQTADAQFFMKDYPKAMQTYERLLLLGDSTFATHYSLAMCYEQMDSIGLAVEHFGRAVTLNDSAKAWPLYHLGAALVKAERRAEGIHVLLMALGKMQPDDATMFNLHWALAEGYYGNEEYYSAIYDWKNCLKYNPQSLASLYNIAQTYELIEDDGHHAREAYQAFLNMTEHVEEPSESLKEWMAHAKGFAERESEE